MTTPNETITLLRLHNGDWRAAGLTLFDLMACGDALLYSIVRAAGPWLKPSEHQDVMRWIKCGTTVWWVRVADTDAALPVAVSADGAADTGTAAPAKVPPRARKAYEQYRKVCTAIDNEKPTDREAYDRLVAANEAAEERGIDVQENVLPRFDTWKRNLRIHRKATDSQKNSSKAGRAAIGKSITNIHGIEPQSLPVTVRPKQYD